MDVAPYVRLLSVFVFAQGGLSKSYILDLFLNAVLGTVYPIGRVLVVVHEMTVIVTTDKLPDYVADVVDREIVRSSVW